MHTEAVRGRSKALAILNKDVGTAEAKRRASAIENAPSHNDVLVVKACYTIVTRSKYAILNSNVVARSDVKAVVTAKYFDVFRGYVLTVVNIMRPVRAVNYGIPIEEYVFHVEHIYRVRTSASTLAFGVIAILTVYIRAALTYY
jgi:hypothetical protein